MTETGFGELLRRFRTAAGLTQEELAERAGLSTRGISDLERGARGLPRRDTLQQLLRALDLSPVDQAALISAAKRAPPQSPRQEAGEAPSGLPIPLTSLIGRETEITAISDQLRDPAVRLLTLTGTGGTGKTRLALEVTQHIAADFQDGVIFVSLAALSNPSFVASAIAHQLGVREIAGQTLLDRLQGHLKGKRLLLVLDNFEHLLVASTFVGDLLRICPTLTVLTTSRAPLRLSGERLYPVPPLELPDPDRLPPLSELARVESVRLFVERVQAVQPDFVLTETNAATIGEIVHRLDGLPLAVELAAPRIRVLPPTALLARLDRRLPLLTEGARDAPVRQRTLRDTIAWSYELLSPQEQTLFRRLAVFAGGWTLEAAEAVATVDDSIDVLDGLSSLVDVGLIRLDERRAAPRFGMLETIHEFAMERFIGSSDEAAVRDAHALYMLRFTQHLEQAQFGPDRRVWEGHLYPEIANIRAALSWLERQGRAAQMQQLASAVSLSLMGRTNVREASDWLERALALPAPAEPVTRAGALFAAGLSAWYRADNPAARAYGITALAISREAADDLENGRALYLLSLVGLEEGNYAEAAARGEEAIRFFRQCGAKIWLAITLDDTGFATALGGSVERATALWEEGIALNRAQDNVWSVAVALDTMGVAAEARGDLHAALDGYRESLEILRDIDDEFYIAHPLAGTASVAAWTEHMPLAARLLGAVAKLHETRGTMAIKLKRERDARTVARAHAALGPQLYDEEFARGHCLSADEAAQQALAAVDTLSFHLHSAM